MKILISTLGSRGDFQPFVALALGLQQAGHVVTITTPQALAPWVRAYGVGVYPVRFDSQQVMQTLAKSGNPFQAMQKMREVLQREMLAAFEDSWNALEQAEVLIQSGSGSGALEAAARRKLPVVLAQLIPNQASRAFPNFMLPWRFSLGQGYNWLTHQWVNAMLWNFSQALTNQWRARLGLPAWRSSHEMQQEIRQRQIPTLYAYSPSLMPKPADWDEHQHVTGYWFLPPPPDWQPAPELLRFLQDGAAPVYIGFGSVSGRNPAQQTRTALRALEISGQRAVLARGWGGLAQPGALPGVYCVDEVPHAWLFERLSAVVHHGGAGTTGAVLRSRAVNVITPFSGDQYGWADLVQKAGVGLAVPGGQSRAEKLARAIQTAVGDQALRARAAALAQQIQAEQGVARAVALVGRYAY